MFVSESNRFSWNPNEKETLVFMEKVGSLVQVIEEGDISDLETTSVEEISEEDFIQEAKVISKSKPKGDPRVWMEGFLNYSVSSVMREFESDEKSKLHSSNVLMNNREDNNASLYSKKEVCSIIIDDSSEEIDTRMDEADGDEKEEGELEDGEIELDSPIVEKVEEEGIWVVSSDRNLQIREFEMKIKSIREALDTATVKDPKESYNEVCSRFRISLESLQLMRLDNCVPVVDALIQQIFMGIQAVNSVFYSMNPEQQEQDKDILLRLLTYVKDQDFALFASKQKKEIEAMIRCVESQSISSSVIMDKKKERGVINGMKLNGLGNLDEDPSGHSLNSTKKFHLEPVSVQYRDQNDSNMEFKTLKSKGYGGVGSLNLPSDHDGDRTLDTLQLFPIQNQSDSATCTVSDKTEDAAVLPYETDALRAVSTYQQRFNSSFLLSNRLPSPTPSVECDDQDRDSSGEVSISSTASSIKTENPSVPVQPFTYATPIVDCSSEQESIPAKTGQLGSCLNPILKAMPKSKDPRRALDLKQQSLTVDYNVPKSEPIVGTMCSRKHKIVEESVLDGQNLKRQRNGLTSSEVPVSRIEQMASRNDRWFGSGCSALPQHNDNKTCLAENMRTDFRKLENGKFCSGKRQDTNSGGNQQLPVFGTNTFVSLPSLKDISMNPTMLVNLIMEQQKLVADTQQKPAQSMTLPSISSVAIGTVPLVNDPSSNSAKIVQKSQIPAQIVPMDLRGDLGKTRMKPRDPRRVLLNNTFKQNGCIGTEQLKTKGVPSSIIQASKDSLTVRQHAEQAQISSPPTQFAPTPAKQNNIPGTLSDSQSATSLTTVAQTVSSQPIPRKIYNADVRVVATDSNNQESWTNSTPKEGAVVSFQSRNAWEDVEHLFEGFDDQQKATIRRERARRKEEQNKLFAARKLCLVLDLDHTLLNSAKFVEVDPVHEMILRKKEEQDRQKPQRHLFRFPHMGMWTKLRPGIWNFLEKASKLYELHLYTMGNKLYAREMAKVLDPTGSLFGERVISRGDDEDPLDGDERVPKIKDLDGVLGMESSVVIIDDSARVWPHNKLNLIALERYIYFPCSRRHFGLSGPSLLEIGHDERLDDGALASSLAVIERIHHNFFLHQSLNDVDVRNILAKEQKNVLAGCRIVFSRVFPVGEAKPHLHPLWQTAQQFGAVCTNQIDEHVTHVVANSLGTDKVNWALSTGRFVVHPCWVEASALLYRRANEFDFAIKTKQSSPLSNLQNHIPTVN